MTKRHKNHKRPQSASYKEALRPGHVFLASEDNPDRCKECGAIEKAHGFLVLW